jgi:hypothetical protein
VSDLCFGHEPANREFWDLNLPHASVFVTTTVSLLTWPNGIFANCPLKFYFSDFLVLGLTILGGDLQKKKLTTSEN